MVRLEDIEKGNKFILWDTCALTGYLHEPKDDFSINYIENCCKFITKLKFLVEDGKSFYITKGVMNECLNHVSNYNSGINPVNFALTRGTRMGREHFISEATKQNKNPVNKSIRKKIRKTFSLIKSFQDNQKILQLNDEEQKMYSSLSEKHLWFKEEYGLSRVDFDLVPSVAAISQTRGPSAMISNDFKGILPCWEYILRTEKISPAQFGFYSHSGFVDFQKQMPF